MVTRKDFIEAAGIVRGYGDEALRRQVCFAFVLLFERLNPRFDRARFERASGVVLYREARHADA